jgi:hypothetical protein
MGAGVQDCGCGHCPVYVLRKTTPSAHAAPAARAIRQIVFQLSFDEDRILTDIKARQRARANIPRAALSILLL